MKNIEFIFIMLIVYQLKHFIADYPLQNRYMLGKFKADWSFIGPLTAHAGLHASFTFFIAMVALSGSSDLIDIVALAFFDFIIHFFMDRIKAGPKYLGRFKDMTKPYFWIALGFDQMVHHITHYAIIFVIYHKWIVLK